MTKPAAAFPLLAGNALNEQGLAHDFDRLLHRADLERHILAQCLRREKLDSTDRDGLKALLSRGDFVDAGEQIRDRIATGTVSDGLGGDAGLRASDNDGRAGNCRAGRVSDLSENRSCYVLAAQNGAGQGNDDCSETNPPLTHTAIASLSRD